MKLTLVFSSSFLSDYQLVVDAKILVHCHPRDQVPAVVPTELLSPERHKISLPLHGMNMLFQDEPSVSINHHYKLDANRCAPPPFPPLRYLS